MANQKNTERGQNLKRFREKHYKNARCAVDVFVSKGCSITYERYCALERGSMPDDREVRQICTMLNIVPHDWLYGHDPDFTTHCNQFLELSPKVRRIAMEFISLDDDIQRLAMSIMSDIKQHSDERRNSDDLGLRKA